MQNDRLIKLKKKGVEIDVDPEQAKGYLDSGWKEAKAPKPIKTKEAK